MYISNTSYVYIFCLFDEIISRNDHSIHYDVTDVEDSGAEVNRRSLVPKVPDSNPGMSGFCFFFIFIANGAGTG